jgi:hypothetical protein
MNLAVGKKDAKGKTVSRFSEVIEVNGDYDPFKSFLKMSLVSINDEKNCSWKQLLKLYCSWQCCLLFVKKHLEQPKVAGLRDLYSLVLFNDQVSWS